jgi:hypothetical protein
MKRMIVALMLVVAVLCGGLAGCRTDAQVASQNLSQQAEMFEIERRIVFYNGITDTYILAIEGRCSVDFYPQKFEVTCKTGKDEFKKHYLGRADNVFPFVEQLDGHDVSVYRYKVNFKPSVIIPDIDLDVGK